MPRNRPRTRLSGLDLSMVSLVPAGDDPMAKAVLFKAAPEEEPGDLRLSDDFRHQDVVEKVRRVRSAAGSKRYGVPIGSPIPSGAQRLANLKDKGKYTPGKKKSGVGQSKRRSTGGDSIRGLIEQGRYTLGQGSRGSVSSAPTGGRTRARASSTDAPAGSGRTVSQRAQSWMTDRQKAEYQAFSPSQKTHVRRSLQRMANVMGEDSLSGSAVESAFAYARQGRSYGDRPKDRMDRLKQQGSYTPRKKAKPKVKARKKPSGKKNMNRKKAIQGLMAAGALTVPARPKSIPTRSRTRR